MKLNPDLSSGFCDEGLKYNLPAGKAGKIRYLGEPAWPVGREV